MGETGTAYVLIWFLGFYGADDNPNPGQDRLYA
jgi:hypothetical protein